MNLCFDAGTQSNISNILRLLVWAFQNANPKGLIFDKLSHGQVAYFNVGIFYIS